MADISIANIAPTDANAKALRAVGKYGMHLADFAALTTGSSFTGFGNGTGYTVGNWVSDGVFADIAAAQAVYPIIQDGTDHVDWVLLQSAVNFLIYGALGSANKQNMKRKLIVPAGHFLINRTLHVGYARFGTPPADLNANGYGSVSIEGEGSQVDKSGNGMTGTTILTEDTTYLGIALTGYQKVHLKGFSLNGPIYNWMQNNLPYRSANNWDRTAWRAPGIADANWLGGAAVNVGIAMDPYSNATSAAAYPARILPAAFGSGTTSASTGLAGTTVEMEDIRVEGYVIGVGRPHGDANGEFFRLHNCDINWCVHSFVTGHSQNRNVSMINVNIEAFHTAIGSRGGLTGNANMSGTYQNVHFGRGFQLVDHPNADWSGPMTLRDCYAESFFRIGDWGGDLRLDGCFLSFLDQEDNWPVTYNHGNISRLILDNTHLSGLSNGLHLQFAYDGASKIEITNGAGLRGGGGQPNYNNLTAPEILKVGAGRDYIQGIYSKPWPDSRIFNTGVAITQGGNEGNQNFWPNERMVMTYLDQQFTTYASRHPNGEYPSPGGSPFMQGSTQRFFVPKITQRQLSVTVNSRSGFDITCDRTSIGDLKADVGDIFGFEPSTGDVALRSPTWFICISVTTSTMVLRQQNNYHRTSLYDYSTTGYDWVQIGAGSHNTQYICTRIRQNIKLFVGDVTSGSAVITNIRHAFAYGATDDFNADAFNTWYGMSVGDYFLHQEIDRANTGGSGLKVHNQVSAIDFTANTITLTETFNITQKNYPIVFYVKRYTA